MNWLHVYERAFGRMYMNNTGEEVLTRQLNGRSQQLDPSCSTCIANNMDGRLSIHTEPQALSLHRFQSRI